MNIIRNYHIEYCCISSLGKIRKNNEDNFYAAGNIREDFNSTEDTIVSGEVSSQDNNCFAVFDGMGGEALGEVASFIAASHTKDFCEDRENYDEYIYELSEILNKKVYEETQARSLVLMGTTAAMVQFGRDSVYILGAGDSRVYRLQKNDLCQITKDHIAFSYGGKAITKFLGMPDEDKPLSPYIAQAKYHSSDLYLICSDGVSDMLKSDELEEIMRQKKPVDVLCREIIDQALLKGGVDNTTAILLKVKQGLFR